MHHLKSLAHALQMVQRAQEPGTLWWAAEKDDDTSYQGLHGGAAGYAVWGPGGAGLQQPLVSFYLYGPILQSQNPEFFP